MFSLPAPLGATVIAAAARHKMHGQERRGVVPVLTRCSGSAVMDLRKNAFLVAAAHALVDGIGQVAVNVASCPAR